MMAKVLKEKKLIKNKWFWILIIIIFIIGVSVGFIIGVQSTIQFIRTEAGLEKLCQLLLS